MTTTLLHNLANALFSTWLEHNQEYGKGEYLSETTNFVLAFDEYLNKTPFIRIKELLPTLRQEEFADLKKYISDGIEHYLLENAKILALS